MSTEKEMKSRVVLKSDIEAHWEKATNFIPKKGELIIYLPDDTYDYPRFKVGDGETLVSSLPFTEEHLIELIDDLTAADIGAVPTSRTINGKDLSSDITLSASDVKALPSSTHIPSTLSEMTADDNNMTMTKAEKEKLAGIAAGANKYSHPSTHAASMITGLATIATTGNYNDLSNKPTIPSVGNATVTINQKGSKVGSFTLNQSSNVTIDLSDTDTDTTYAAGTGLTLSGTTFKTKLKSDSSLGTIGTTSQLYAVGVDKNGQLCVNVPWTDTNTNTTYTAGTGLTLSDTTFKVKLNSESSLGTIGTTAQLYAVGVDKNGKLCVNVPWSDTTYSTGTSSTEGLTKLYTSTGSNTDGTMTRKAITEALEGKEVSGAAATALSDAKNYTDGKISALVNGAPEALDTLDELAAALNDNKDILSTFATKTGLKDHSDSNVHVTSTERTNWNAAYTHSTSSHAPSNAEKNQNAFSNIVVGSATIAAETATDTVTFVAGSNVTLTPDANNDKITIAAKDTVYSHPSYTARASGLYKITVDASGHVSDVASVEKSDITTLGIPAQDTVYSHPSTHPVSMITGLATVATSGSYNDLSNKPTIPSVGNGTITINQNGTKKGSFTLNQTGNVTINLTDTNTDTNTTYSAGTGISLSGTKFSNSGVRSIATGSANGTISVNTGGTTANVAVKGLGSAAYTASTAYATAAQGTKADKALPAANISGTSGRLAKFTASNKLGNSLFSDNGSVAKIHSRLVVAGNGSSFNEGIRILPASNGWSNIFLSGNSTEEGCHDGGWLIARRGADGIKSGAIGDFTIENNGSDGAGLTLRTNGTMIWYGSVLKMNANRFTLQCTNSAVKFVFS